MTKAEAMLLVGGLSHTSKMPCPSFSLPPAACVTGSKLSQVEGTTCSKCYAKKGNYVRFAKVAESQERNLDRLNHWMAHDPGKWVEAMVTLIRPYAYFRWHDAGDLQCAEHFTMVRDVAWALPETKFWLPTHEVWAAAAARTKGHPKNLVVRLSAVSIDKPGSKSHPHTSTVHWHKPPMPGMVCRANENAGKCGDCRHCWDADVGNISYPFH